MEMDLAVPGYNAVVTQAACNLAREELMRHCFWDKTPYAISSTLQTLLHLASVPLGLILSPGSPIESPSH